MSKNILLIATNHDRLGATSKPTGVWLEELAAPYFAFINAGYDVVIVSPAGGEIAIDPASKDSDALTADAERFMNDKTLKGLLKNTKSVTDVHPNDFDAVFFAGGHGTVWDFADDGPVTRLVEQFAWQKKAIGAVCHGVVALVHAKNSDGSSLVDGLHLTSFTDAEEKAVGLDDVVPFLLESRLRSLGADYDHAAPFEPFVVTNKHIITGQNPASSEATAHALIAHLEDKQEQAA